MDDLISRQDAIDAMDHYKAGAGMKFKILDATCGDQSIWFQKHEPHTTYCDIRSEEWEGDFGKTLNKDGKKKHRHLIIAPDIQCDFTNLPFNAYEFNLVVFDPPHIENLGNNAWMRKAYGSLDGDWRSMIRQGFKECMRVLKPGGVLVFKWSDISVSTREILNVIGREPLFGHRSGKKMNTHWMCFMKFEDEYADKALTQPEQRYTEEELRVFQHGISLSLLSKRSAQHWQYDEDTATEIEFLERLYDKVSADMKGGQG